MYIRVVYSLLLAISFLTSSGRADDGRNKFRQDLLRLGSPENILTCINKLEPGVSPNYPDGFSRKQKYSLVIGPTGSGVLKDAFMLEFHSKGEIEFSTVIAYEGFNGHIMGTLQVSKDSSGNLIQIHKFNGAAFLDITQIEAGTHGLILTYTKTLPSGKLAQKITCEPVGR